MQSIFSRSRQLPSCFQLILLTLLLVTLTPLSRAQFNASISGTVTDTTGAVIPGAAVLLTSDDTHTTRTATTGGEGFYQFNELSPGSYSITVTAAGFEKESSSNVIVAAERPRSFDVKLKTGGATETVTVNANDTPALQTSDASVSGTIDGEELRRIPTFGGDPYELLRTAPGITGDSARSGTGGSVSFPNAQGPGQSNNGIFQVENQVQISAAGQRTTSNTFLIDGVHVDSLEHGGSAVVTPNEESIQAITVTATSYDASEGRNSGAQIKTTSKAGSNNLHGSAYFLYDQPGLNAFQSYGGPQGALDQRVNNQARTYAASLGGPIWRDKFFLFGSFQAYRARNQQFTQNYVETPQFIAAVAAQRPGSVINKLLTAPGSKPRIVAVLGQSCASFTNEPCAVVNGGIDLGSPVGAQGQYVSINSPGGGGLDGIPDLQYVETAAPQNTRGNQFNGRGDFYLTPRDQFTGGAYFTRLDLDNADPSTGGRPYADLIEKPLNSAITALYIRTISPTLINELRSNFTRFHAAGVKDASNTNFGLPRVNTEAIGINVPQLEFAAPQGETSPYNPAQNTYETLDMVTKVLPWGSLRAGIDVRFQQDNSNYTGANRPLYVDHNLWNLFNDTPIYEQISANPNTGGPSLDYRHYREHDYEAFVQHDWRVKPNFTVNLGLRYQYFGPIYNEGFKSLQFVLGPTGHELSGSTLQPVNHLYNENKLNFAPKFGFAWSPAIYNDRVVFRGGVGSAYDRFDEIMFANNRQNGPGYNSFGICCGTAKSDFSTPFDGGQIVYETGSSNSPNSYAPNPALATGVNPATGAPANAQIYGTFPRSPSAVEYLYSLETQIQLPWQLVGTIGYQGDTGRHFMRFVYLPFFYSNTGNPFGGGVYISKPDTNNYYNGLNAHLERRFQHGVSANIVYSFAQSIDQLSFEGPGSLSNQTDPVDQRTERGPSDFDEHNRVTISGVWEVPTPFTGVPKTLLGGFQINGIYSWHTGDPWTPTVYNPNALPQIAGGATVNPQRPYQEIRQPGSSCSNSAFIRGTNFGGTNGTPYFVSASPAPTQGEATGTVHPGIGRNSFRGPCYEDTDISVAKQFTYHAMDHDTLLRIQANFFNAFNKLNLQPLQNYQATTTIGNGQFGLSPGADAGRVIELSARFQF
ncbi:MAG TPA: TonB-dependent receptor [Acidisarcina sp.]